MRCSFFLSLLLIVACGDDTTPMDDSGPRPDVPGVDAGPSDAGTMDANVPGRSWEIVAPPAVPAEVQYPIVIRAMADGALDTTASGDFDVFIDHADFTYELTVRMRRGIGSLTVTKPIVADTSVVRVGGASIMVEDLPDAPTVLEGELTNLNWSGVIQLSANAIVPAGQTLTIEPGTVVLLASERSIIVNGALNIAAGGPMTLFAPITESAPWGGITVNGSAIFENAGLVGAGANLGRAFGHSNSQPILFSEDAPITFRNSVIQDGPGKAFGARGGDWTIDGCLITRLDTGGEFELSTIAITNSQWMDFPTIDPPAVDDDNDGLYLLGDSSAEQPLITIDGSTFITGADDGIDHNGSRVEITNTWVEDFDNECIATSSGGTVNVSDTLLTGCGQGLEAGYGGPQVTGDHLLIRNSGTGVRLGDGYSDRPDYSGTITLTDSIVQGNTDFAVLNLVLTDNMPRPGAISISTSVVDRDEVEVGDGNVTDTAVLGDDLLMAPGSPGEGIAAGGGNPGLVTPR